MRSGVWGGQSMTVSVPLGVFLARHAYTQLAVCLGSWPCWKIKPSPIRGFPDATAWWIDIWWYFSSFVILSVLTRSWTLEAWMQPQTIMDLLTCSVHIENNLKNKFLIQMHHFMRPVVTGFQFSCNLAYL